MSLSEDLICKLISYLETVGLVYGVFDLIVTPADEVFFLECNPDGNWLWLNDVANGSLVKSYADMLIENAVLTGGAK